MAQCVMVVGLPDNGGVVISGPSLDWARFAGRSVRAPGLMSEASDHQLAFVRRRVSGRPVSRVFDSGHSHEAKRVIPQNVASLRRIETRKLRSKLTRFGEALWVGKI
jgi:hypothetical protein